MPLAEIDHCWRLLSCLFAAAQHHARSMPIPASCWVGLPLLQHRAFAIEIQSFDASDHSIRMLVPEEVHLKDWIFYENWCSAVLVLIFIVLSFIKLMSSVKIFLKSYQTNNFFVDGGPSSTSSLSSSASISPSSYHPHPNPQLIGLITILSESSQTNCLVR